MALKIGIFDSGIGGLSVVKKIREKFEGLDIYYLADKKFAPYGELKRDAILNRALWCGEKLAEIGADMIVVACNTATAAGVEALRQKLSIPVIGVEPDLNFHLRSEDRVRPQDICVLCTNYTLKSPRFIDLQRRRDPESKMNYVGLKNLARLVEECFWNSSERVEGEKKIFADLEQHFSDNERKIFILGCTHYELIDSLIQEKLNVFTVGVSEAISQRCDEVIKTSGLNNNGFADSCGGFYFFNSEKEKGDWEQLDLEKFISWPRT